MNVVKLIDGTWFGYFSLGNNYLGYYQTAQIKGWLTHTCQQCDATKEDALLRAGNEYRSLLNAEKEKEKQNELNRRLAKIMAVKTKKRLDMENAKKLKREMKTKNNIKKVVPIEVSTESAVIEDADDDINYPDDWEM